MEQGKQHDLKVQRDYSGKILSLKIMVKQVQLVSYMVCPGLKSQLKN
jgi:hypothetical protein